MQSDSRARIAPDLTGCCLVLSLRAAGITQPGTCSPSLRFAPKDEAWNILAAFVVDVH